MVNWATFPYRVLAHSYGAHSHIPCNFHNQFTPICHLACHSFSANTLIHTHTHINIWWNVSDTKSVLYFRLYKHPHPHPHPHTPIHSYTQIFNRQTVLFQLLAYLQRAKIKLSLKLQKVMNYTQLAATNRPPPSRARLAADPTVVRWPVSWQCKVSHFFFLFLSFQFWASEPNDRRRLP